jgi:hypothetical protein
VFPIATAFYAMILWMRNANIGEFQFRDDFAKHLTREIFLLVPAILREIKISWRLVPYVLE